MISIKSPAEISAMREGGKILADILHELAISAKIGMRTEELNIKAEALIEKYGVLPSFKGYHGYPAVICVSVNEEVVHGIPGKRVLRDGDIVSIDGGVIHKGFHSDAAVAVMLGNVEPEVRTFVKTVAKSFEKALAVIRPGNKTGDIGFAVQHYIETNGYSVVRDFIGHGVGRNLHEDPPIPNWGQRGKGSLLVPGMTIAVEPIISMGKRFVEILRDGWTAVTKDGSPACQVEHTIAITTNGCEVLTKYNKTINTIYSQ
ncbi:type I methionyl aminopeptidase [Candidatus Peregrinibacteria bacterium]|nr:type I methionyl aminopeptidase [Candidatus Peregrinibacteria bacterium]